MHILSTTSFFHRKKIVSNEINGENMVCIRISKRVKGESHEIKMDKSRFEHDNVATNLSLAARHRQADRTQGKKFLQGNLLTLFCVLYVDDGTFNSNWVNH